MIKIRLNGELRDLQNPMIVDQLLAELGFAGKPVVVELNEDAVFPRDYSSVWVNDGARVEIVALAAGG